jgi:hypothetical protein
LGTRKAFPKEREVGIMKFIVHKASDHCYEEIKEFKTLEELKTFQQENEEGYSLILDFNTKNEITIFDDFL